MKKANILKTLSVMILFSIIQTSCWSLLNWDSSNTFKKEEDPLKHYQNEEVSETVQHFFLKAIRENDMDKVKQFLDNGAKMNYCKAYAAEYPGKVGYRIYDHPLCLSIFTKSTEVTKFLLENEPMLINSQCLHTAIHIGDMETFNYLVEKGANLNLIGNEQAQYYRDEGYHGVRTYYASKYWWNTYELLDGTPIYFALKTGKINFVERLMELGVPLTDKEKEDALIDIYKSLSDYKTAAYILSTGLNPNFRRNHYDRGNLSWTPMDWALNSYPTRSYDVKSAKRIQEFMKLLILHGARPDGVLLRAVQINDNLEFIKFLLEKGANINEVSKYNNKDNVLTSALPKYKEFLIMNGAR